MPALKNQRHELFCQELAKGKSASEAYVLAGYKANDGNAATLKGNQKVKDRVDELLKRVAARMEITQARILQELALIGFSNMLDYVKVTSDGDAYVDLSNITRDQAAAIQEIVVEDYVDGRGDDARDVRRTKFKLADKRGALVDIGKHLGMFIDRKDFRISTGYDKLTDAELAEQLVKAGQMLLEDQSKVIDHEENET